MSRLRKHAGLCLALLCLALMPAWVARGQTPPSGTTLSLKITFPHEVSCSSFDSQAGDGRTFWRLCESQQDGVIATLQTGLFPDGSIDVDPVLARSVAQALIDASTAQLVDGKWDKIEWIDYQGGQGFEAVGRRVDGRVHRLLSIVKGTRVYYITGITPEGRSEIDGFFDSVQLN